MKHTYHRIQHGFTLIELLAAILVMSIISVTLMPVIASASESYIVARQVVGSTERAAFAIERITRIVRQAPIGPSDEGVGIANATTTSVEFTDQTGVQLVGTQLEMLVAGADPVPLCFNVESFEIRYIGADGLTNTILDPTNTHRIEFMITTQGTQLSVLAHPRVWIGQGAP